MQQPPYPPNQPPYGNQPPYPPYPPQHPGGFGPPPQQPRRGPWAWYRRQSRALQVVLGILVLACVLCVCSSALAGVIQGATGATSTPAAQSQHTQTANAPATPYPTTGVIHHPTVVPTTKPTGAPAPTQPGNPTMAMLGGTLADFEARYGHLNSHSDPSKGEYYFSVYGNDKNDIIVEFIYNPHTDGIIYGAPSPKLWSSTEAKSACMGLMPSDAVYQRKMTTYDSTGQPQDEQLVYYSPSIGKMFPADAFNDEYGNQTKAGTIALILTHWDLSTYVQCVVQVGLESK